VADAVIDIAALSAQGAALQAAGRLEGAIAVYGRVIEAAPHSGVAEHNLAGVYGDNHQFAESEAAARRALAKGLDAPETWLVLARALQGLGQFDEAEAAFRQSIARRPAYADAHRDLAQLIWMRGENLGEARASLDIAIAANPGEVPLRLAASKLIEYAGDPEAAYGVLDAGLTDGRPDPRLDIAAAQLRLETDPASALAHASRAYARAPEDALALTTLCQANLALGRADLAAAQAAALREAAPFDQQAVALQATAWRLLGDPRYGELYDYARLVREWTLDTPPGWSNLKTYLADLAQSLAAVHRLRGHPVGQSLRGGAQTTQNLDRVGDPVIKAFFKAVDRPIRRHIAAIGERGDYRLNGVWSVRLRLHRAAEDGRSGPRGLDRLWRARRADQPAAAAAAFRQARAGQAGAVSRLYVARDGALHRRRTPAECRLRRGAGGALMCRGRARKRDWPAECSSNLTTS
jgi:tetratricopeptide (TPR) repeat protein